MNKLLIIPLLLALISCASNNQPFSSGVAQAGTAPLVYVHVVNEDLGLDGPNYYALQRESIIDPGSSQPMTTGALATDLVGSAFALAAIAVLESEELNQAEELFNSIADSIANFRFEERFQAAFRGSLVESGLVTAGELRPVSFAYDYAEAEAGNIIVQARHSLSYFCSLLRVSVSASRRVASGPGKGWYSTTYLYEFKLPGTTEHSNERLLNLRRWAENTDLIKFLLGQGIETTLDLMARSIVGELSVEGAEEIILKPEYSQLKYSTLYRISHREHRITVADEKLGLIASIPASHVGDGDEATISLQDFKTAMGYAGDAMFNASDTGFDAAKPPRDISGTYSDNLNMIVRLRQEGKRVTGRIGAIGGDNEIRGVVRNGEFGFTFKFSPTTFGVKDGTGKLTIIADGSRLVGHRSGGTFPAQTAWELTRVELDENKAFLDDAQTGNKEIIDVSGRYESRVSGGELFYFTSTETRPDVVIEQVGSRLNGKFGKYLSGIFTGEVSGDRILIEWSTKMGEGTARFVVNPDTGEINGSWQGNDGNSGEWNLDRRM